MAGPRVICREKKANEKGRNRKEKQKYVIKAYLLVPRWGCLLIPSWDSAGGYLERKRTREHKLSQLLPLLRSYSMSIQSGPSTRNVLTDIWYWNRFGSSSGLCRRVSKSMCIFSYGLFFNIYCIYSIPCFGTGWVVFYTQDRSKQKSFTFVQIFGISKV